MPWAMQKKLVISQDDMGNQGKTQKRGGWGGWGSERSQMGGFKYCNESWQSRDERGSVLSTCIEVLRHRKAQKGLGEAVLEVGRKGWKGGDKSTKWDSRASTGSWMERDGNEETKRQNCSRQGWKLMWDSKGRDILRKQWPTQLSQRPAWGYCSGGRNTWICTTFRCNAKREKQRHTMKMKCKTAVHITIIKKKRSTQERWNARQQHVLIIKKKERHIKEGEMWDSGTERNIETLL
jgi:hypothetical protein